ncbi:MAG TPA: hypothetical protein VFJ45_02645 [bacterium]|nr:hypothetical protein [bacterium]
MVRPTVAILLVLSFWPAASAAAGPEMTVKGFVVSRSVGALAIRHIDGSMVTVRLMNATVISGVRASRGEIALGDLIRAEGVREGDGSGDDVILASRVEVVLGAEALERSRPAPTSVFWNWILNGSLSVPLR